MFEKRIHTRFPCLREVDIAYFRAGRRCAVHQGIVCDISEVGLRLQLPEAAPECDRVLVRTGALVIPYVIRTRFMRDGVHYVGAEALKTSA